MGGKNQGYMAALISARNYTNEWKKTKKNIAVQHALYSMAHSESEHWVFCYWLQFSYDMSLETIFYAQAFMP